MYRVRPIYEPHVKVVSTYFPYWVPKSIGPRLELPLRPRLFPYRLLNNQKKSITPRRLTLHRYANPLYKTEQFFDALTQVAISKYRSSAITPKEIKAKNANEFWKRGWKKPLKSYYAMGCHRPTKPFDPPTSEHHFRVVHPQFSKFFDKWGQPDINWNDQRNVQMMTDEMQEILKITPGQRQLTKGISKLVRPHPFAGFMQHQLLFAQMSEYGALKRNYKNPEKLLERSEYHSRQILDIYYGMDAQQQKVGQPP